MSKIEEIKKQAQSECITNDREAFFKAVAEEFKMKTSSVRVGWFTRFEIPERYNVQQRVLDFMKEYNSEKEQSC